MIAKCPAECHDIGRGSLVGRQNYGLLLELLVLVSSVLDELVVTELLGALLVIVLLVPRSVPYWSDVPPCSLLQPASINAAPRIRIAFFMVQSFVALFSLCTSSVLNLT